MLDLQLATGHTRPGTTTSVRNRMLESLGVNEEPSEAAVSITYVTDDERQKHRVRR